MLRGNKGEWSEIYAFLRLLADGRLFAADEQLNRIENMFFPIIKIIREETRGTPYEYNTGEIVRVVLNGEVVAEVPVELFISEAQHLLDEILAQGSNGTFAVEGTNAFMNRLYVNKLTAPSTDKSDISIELHDANTGYEQIVGFSIKSKLGSPSTLLNASGSTNFVYRVDGLPEIDIGRINAINTPRKLKDRIAAINESGGTLIFVGVESETFNANLKMIDSQMPSVVAEMLLNYFSGNGVNCRDLLVRIQDNNLLEMNSAFYEHKLKELLCAVALGLKPATLWDGTDEATGGYIIVKQDGDVLAYHIYNRDAFRGYLLNNTKFEGASSTRHHYGSLYTQAGATYIKLALQIRFI